MVHYFREEGYRGGVLIYTKYYQADFMEVWNGEEFVMAWVVGAEMPTGWEPGVNDIQVV